MGKGSPPSSRCKAGWVLLALLWLLLLLIVASAFVRAYFGPVTPDQLAFHLRHGGLEYADPRFVQRALRWGAGLVLLGAASVWLLARLGRSGLPSGGALTRGTGGQRVSAWRICCASGGRWPARGVRVSRPARMCRRVTAGAAQPPARRRASGAGRRFAVAGQPLRRAALCSRSG